MSELYREQYPLLCDEPSEEERYSPRNQRCLRPMVYRGRARNQVHGAAAIFKRWPDHWSSFFTYLWIALGMVALTTFIIYNSLFIYALLPSVKPKSIKPLPINTIENTSHSPLQLQDVYMHVLVNNSEDVDLNKYLPYIEIIANKYVNFKYHLVIVLNDASTDVSLSDGEHNDIALNSLLNSDVANKNEVRDNPRICIEHVTLSQYMNDSPLRKYWTLLSYQFTEFLLRAISIWEKGGIAFNPIILTPQSTNSIYIVKIHNILKRYESPETKSYNYNQSKKQNNKSRKAKHKVNNIRDIIDALELENDSTDSFQQILLEAENQDNPIAAQSGRKLLSIAEMNKNNTNTKSLKQQNFTKTLNLAANGTKQLDLYKNVEDTSVSKSNSSSTAKLSLLPLFLEYLFHNKPIIKKTKHPETISTNTVNRKRKSPTIMQMQKIKENESLNSIVASNVNRTSPKLGSKDIYNSEALSKTESGHEDELTIDIKGNIMATKTSCHAFIGTIFGNVIHHGEDESLSNLIITELFLFCKGLLASCTGIDLILL